MQLKEKLDINPILICLGNILQEAKASHLGRTNKAFCKLLMIMMITTKDKRVLLSYFSCFHYGYTPNCEMSCMSLNSRGWTCKHYKSTYQYPPPFRLQKIHATKVLAFERPKIYPRFQWMKIKLVLNCIYVRKGYK